MLKHKAKLLLTITIIVTSILTTEGFCKSKPDSKFLKSIVGGPALTMPVEDFIEILRNVKMDNGKHPQIGKWSVKDNVYTLDIKMGEKIKLQFIHQLNYDGKSSVLNVDINGTPVNAVTFFYTIFSMPRDLTSYDMRLAKKLKNKNKKR